MNPKQINRIIELLKEKGVSFDKGLSDNEVERLENVFGINLPQDLKLLLQTELPISPGFVHWRYGINSEKGKVEIKNRLDWPKEGMLFDIKYGSFWLNDWGDKPARFEDQKEIAIIEMAKHPKLIPIYSHRYISSKPYEMGNPVFSVYQMDIIHYGVDLADYFAHEFGLELPASFGTVSVPQRIDFWSDMIDLNNSLK